MKISRRLLKYAILLPLLASNATAKSVKEQAQNFIKTLQKEKHAHIGLIITNERNNKVLYRHDAFQYFIPASIQKLFTAAAAALYLKPNYRFNTQLFYTGMIHRHTLVGDLYIKFSGDPTLKEKQLNRLIKTLKKDHIQEITGHVNLDASSFNSILYPPGVIWDNLSYSFASPTSPIIINENKFLLHFIPNKNKTRPKLKADLPKQAATFTNHVKSFNHRVKDCPITIYSTSNNHYIIGGCFNRKLGEQRRSLAIRNIDRVTKLDIAQTLQHLKIHFHSNIRIKKTPPASNLLATHRSKPLKKIIRTMIKESDNLISNSLLKTLGATYYHRTGNWQNGLKALAKILSPITKIQFNKTRITDGAGLSRYNLIEPQQVMALLKAIRKNTILKQTLYPALPIAGRDGTLSWRLPSLKKYRRLRAKTGTMTGVSNLAGYVRTRRHGNSYFVLLINGFVDKPRDIQKRTDRFLKKLILS